MKRYFTFEKLPDPTKYNPHGMWHAMSLPGGGYVCVLDEESSQVPSDWVELPHLLDSSPANFNGVNTARGAYVHPAAATTPAPLPRAGILVTDSMFQVAKKLTTENPLFRP